MYHQFLEILSLTLYHNYTNINLYKLDLINYNEIIPQLYIHKLSNYYIILQLFKLIEIPQLFIIKFTTNFKLLLINLLHYYYLPQLYIHEM